MPATNFVPEGYELVHHDDQLCRSSVFYVPGSVSANWINANRVAPSFLIYRRREGVSSCRIGRCEHRNRHYQQVAQWKRARAQLETGAKMCSRRVRTKIQDETNAEKERAQKVAIEEYMHKP